MLTGQREEDVVEGRAVHEDFLDRDALELERIDQAGDLLGALGEGDRDAVLALVAVSDLDALRRELLGGVLKGLVAGNLELKALARITPLITQ